MPSTAQSFEIFPWNSNLETGIALIDEQHARLVELLNRLAQQHVQGASAEEIQGILGELADYADYHFHSEEAIWQASLGDDPWFNQHQHSHAAFFQRIQALQDSARPFTEVLSELFAFLTQWLAFHILDSDKRMAKAVFAVADGLDVAAARQRADEEMSGATALLISTVLQMYEQLSSQALELMQEKHARERAEAALRHSESRWKFLLEGSSEGLWEWSAEHGDLFAQLGQLTLPEANDSPSWQLYEEDRQTLQRALGELYSGQQEQLLCHYRLRNAQGASRWMQLRGKVIQRDEQGQVLRLIGTRQDVSERELARQVLQLGHELLFITDHQNRITAINQAFTRVTGYSAEQVLGQSPRLLASDRHDQAFFQALWQALQQQGRWQGEIWNQRADGSQYALQLAIHRQMGPDGKHCQYVAIGHEVTAYLEANAQLQALFASLPDAILVADDLTQRIVSASPQAEQLFGRPCDELLDLPIASLHPLSELAKITHELDKGNSQQHEVRLLETRIRHASGHEVEVEISSGHHFQLHGRSYHVGVFRDIRQRKQQEATLQHYAHELEQRNQELATLFDTLPDLIWLKDPQGRFLRCNARTASLWGLHESQVLGKSDFDLLPREHAEQFRANDLAAIQHGGTQVNEEWLTFADGHSERVQTRNTPLYDRQGQLIGVLGIAHDITALKQQQDALEMQRQHLATALEAAEAGTWEWNPQSHQVRYSPRWAQMLGYQLEELGPPTFAVWENRVHPEDLPQVMQNLQEHLAGQRDSYSAEYRIQHRNGLWLWRRSLGRIMQRDEQQQPLLVVGIDIDITEHKEHQQQLSYVERHDALTGLANRVLFGEMLNHCMQQALQDNSTLAVAYIDLDDFAQLNQQLGRDACDQWLQEVVRRLQGSLREPQYLARTGGDEFAIVLCNLQAPDSYLTPLLRVLESINQPWQQGERQFSCTASIGVTRYPQDSPVDAEQLLRQADQAMYQAKLIGKNRCHLFDAAHDEHTRVQYIRLEEIRQALDNQELRLYFQPKVNMRSGQVKAFEALIRWQHPERGLLPPALFIPALSNQPLALRVGNWVIDQALQQLAQWQALGIDTCVSVNVDSYQLHSDDFAEQLLQRLQQYPQLRPQQLRLEILETGALQDMQHVSQLVDQLQAQGIEFALDDFGTGFSSLTFLKQLRAKTLKIDQSFVRQALEDPEQAMIIDSIVGLARSFEREVIAEGVESEAHGLLMLQLGCELGQGYAIARPMPAQAVAAWLASWQPPASWQASQALDEQGVQLLLAELAHVAWLRQLQEYLSNQQSDAPQAHADSCRFGRWLDKPETRQRYAGREDFQALLKQHAALQELAVQLLRRHREDARQDISQALANLLATSASLMRKLHQLRQSLHASDD